MKKRSKQYEFARGKCANKFMRMMKLTCLLMFVFALHLSAASVAPVSYTHLLPDENKALVIRVDLKPVMIIDLQEILRKEPLEILRRCVELGHAIGNQHWPAIVKGDKVYAVSYTHLDVYKRQDTVFMMQYIDTNIV